MLRRDFMLAVAGMLAVRHRRAAAQSVPVIGYLSTLSEGPATPQLSAFRRGLGETGFAEGRNVAIEYRWAEGRYDRLPVLAAELIRQPVSLILAQAPPAAIAARAATNTIPIVFVVGFDPVRAGLVASLGKPGGNATGMTLISTDLGQKRLEIMRDFVPKAGVAAMLVNSISPDALVELQSVHEGARQLGVQLAQFNASTVEEIRAAFGAIAERRPDFLIIGTDPFFVDRRKVIVAEATRLSIPTIYPFRDYVAEGGLISYGTNIANSFRQAGIYAGRILKGTSPAELPVMQPTTFELVINLRTAAASGIEIPPILHARSDEVIE